MEQNFGWLQQTCRRMVIQLLDSCESDSYDKTQHGMAHSALNYYGSKFSLIPDVIPGLGYLDDFLILVTTMWVCGEKELPEPSQHEEEQLPYRLQHFLAKIEEEEAEKLRLSQLEKLKQKNRARLEEILLEQPKRIREKFASKLGISVDIEKANERSNEKVREKNIQTNKDRTSKMPVKERAESKSKKQLDRNVERSSKLKEMTGNGDLDNPFAKTNEKPESISNTASHM